MVRRLLRFASLLALVAAPSIEAGCFGDGPCLGDCPAPWSVRYEPSGKTGFDQGHFTVDVTADGVHGSLSCMGISCTGTSSDFQVVSPACNGGGCGQGFIVASTGSYPTQVRIAISSSGRQNDDTTFTLTYTSPNDSCGCKLSQTLPKKTL